MFQGFDSADVGTPLTQPPALDLREVCLRLSPAFWTVSLNLTVSSRHYNRFSAAVHVSGFT